VKTKLVAKAKRARKIAIDQHHLKLAFEANEDHIPEEFLKGDILKHGKRHLIFATMEQLQLLTKAKIWYIDQTLHCCPGTFEQLLTISAFVSSEDKDAKNVPLVFVLMSSNKRKDYRKVKPGFHTIATIAAIILLRSLRSLKLDGFQMIAAIARKSRVGMGPLNKPSSNLAQTFERWPPQIKDVLFRRATFLFSLF